MDRHFLDKNIVGIRPDLKVETREDVLEEEDGPMLQHGLQEFNSAPVWVPRKESLRPRPEFLQERYEIFQKLSAGTIGKPGFAADRSFWHQAE